MSDRADKQKPKGFRSYSGYGRNRRKTHHRTKSHRPHIECRHEGAQYADGMGWCPDCGICWQGQFNDHAH